MVLTRYCARDGGDFSGVAGYYRGYSVSLIGLYAAGYRAVRFKADTYQPSNSSSYIRAGVIWKGEFGDASNIESTTKTTSQEKDDYACDWFTLPITENSLELLATCGSDQNTHPEQIFTPEIVYFIDSINQEIFDDIAQLQLKVDNIKNEFPENFLPSKIYGVIGDTLQIFNRETVLAVDPYLWHHSYDCSQGREFNRYYEVTPAKNNGVVPVGLQIKHSLVNAKGESSTESVSSFVISDVPSTSPASPINVLCVGASTTASGQWPSELKRRLTSSLGPGNPKANGLQNINFVGRIARAQSDYCPVPINLEGTGGWAWSSFYTPEAAYRFVISSQEDVTVDTGSVYKYINESGSEVRVIVAESNITQGSGNIRVIHSMSWSTTLSLVPQSSVTTLTIVSGSGDATVEFIPNQSASETYCPFPILTETNLPDFTEYVDRYCSGQLDVVIFNMGTQNEGISSQSKLDSTLNHMKLLLDGIHNDFPNCKVILGCGGGFNSHYDYATSSNLYKKDPVNTYWKHKYFESLDKFVNSDDYVGWCYLADTLLEMDSEYGYPTKSKAVNTRMSDVTEIIGTNNAHPTLEGYQMIADSYYRCFVNTIL